VNWAQSENEATQKRVGSDGDEVGNPDDDGYGNPSLKNYIIISDRKRIKKKIKVKSQWNEKLGNHC